MAKPASAGRAPVVPTPWALPDHSPIGWIKKVGWKGGEKKWPGAYQAVRNFKIDNAQMSQMIVEVDLEGKSVDDTVAKWMRENESTWQGWIK